MKRVFIFVVFLFMLGGLTRVDAQEKETSVKVGDNVPEFVVEMFDGQKIDIKDLKGKIVLINFWATWCPPCQEELKRVQKEIVDRFKGKDFVFLAISREETRDSRMSGHSCTNALAIMTFCRSPSDSSAV